MKVVTVPEYYALKNDDIAVFLAGGITNCEDWQKEVIEYFKSLPEEKTNHLVIFNPRRDKWPKNSDVEEVRRQINWEADYINKSNIFSMYFTNTDKSDQPICFYELGRYARGNDVISYQEGFKRALDVDFQMEILCPTMRINKNITPTKHAELIFERYRQEVNWCHVDDDDYYTDYRPARSRRFRR